MMADFVFDIVIPLTGLFWVGFIYYSMFLSRKYKVLISWTEANKKEKLILNMCILGSLLGTITIILFALINK